MCAFCGVCAAGTILVASAFHIAQLVIGRVILGVGVGFATQATPLYLTEMAPYNLRGALNIMFQLAVTIGIFVAQLINYGVQARQALPLRDCTGEHTPRASCVCGRICVVCCAATMWWCVVVACCGAAAVYL